MLLGSYFMLNYLARFSKTFIQPDIKNDSLIILNNPDIMLYERWHALGMSVFDMQLMHCGNLLSNVIAYWSHILMHGQVVF